MNYSESVKVNLEQLRHLRKLVAAGESLHLEFKRKAAHPDKIVRELIAFANTEGGCLLIGVDDDKSIAGVKYPEEEWLVVRKALLKHCRPALRLKQHIIPISEKKFIVMLEVAKSPKRPHGFRGDNGAMETYVRVADKSVKASREMREIIRRSKSKADIHFTYGEAEQRLMHYLDMHPSITVKEFQRIAQLGFFKASQKLITLVLANVINIRPTDKGDLYWRP